MDRDNFVTNRVTIIDGPAVPATSPERTVPAHQPSRSAVEREPVLSLPEVKMHLRIEADQTVEDGYLTSLEMAARIHTENYLRLELDVAAGENIKVAMLLLIAHWYRNRESSGANTVVELPMAYAAILGPERDFPVY
jgi:hypothetical protein